jgi:hypothetical protein
MPFPSELTTRVFVVQKTKYFPIEIFAANLLPNTAYDAYVGGQLINAFCKPWGGNLGSPIKADNTGKIRFQYMMAVNYNKQFHVQPLANNAVIESTVTITLIDPFNRSSSANIPVMFKAS